MQKTHILARLLTLLISSLVVIGSLRLMSDDQRRQLMDNIAAAMAGVPGQILRRQVAHFAKADPAYGAGVAARVGLGVEIAAS